LSYKQKDKKKPFLEFSLAKSLENTSVNYFNYFAFLIQEMDFRIDDKFVHSLMAFSSEFSSKIQTAASNIFSDASPTTQLCISDFLDNKETGLLAMRDSNKMAKKDLKTQRFSAGTYYFSYCFGNYHRTIFSFFI
jgi:hypothetical protein